MCDRNESEEAGGRRIAQGPEAEAQDRIEAAPPKAADSRPKKERKSDLSPSKKLALSVLRVFIDPAGVPIDDLKDLVDNETRGFWNYKKRLEEVFSQFLSYQVDLEEVREGKSGRKRLRLNADGREKDKQWPLVARMAAYDFVGSLLGGLGSAEIAEQIASAEQEFLTRVSPQFALPFRRNMRRMFYVVPDAPKDYTDREHVDVVNELVRSFWFGRRVKIYYKPPGKPAAVHTVEPLTLALYRSALYLFARFQATPEKTYCSPPTGSRASSRC